MDMKKQILYYISLLKTLNSRFSFNFKNFGFKLAFFNFLGEFGDFHLFRNKGFSKKLLKKQHDAIYNVLVDKYSDIIEEYKSREIPLGLNDKKIWCMWWQGIENAPDLVKACLKSIEKYSGDYELVIITKDNFNDYVDIPQEIIKKFNDENISIAHFSDILRAKLLASYGGVWIDATVFVCDDIFKEFDDMAFNSCLSSRGWSIFLMGGKSNKIYSFLYDVLIQYNLDYDEFINYFLTDFIIEIAYNSFEECREYIDCSNLSNPYIFYFLGNFSKTFDGAEFKSLCEKYKFFKLSYKNSQVFIAQDSDGNLTNYGYFLKYLRDDLK